MYTKKITFLYTSLRVYAIFVGVRKKKKVIERFFVRGALTFTLPDDYRVNVQKRAAYRWKAEILTFPTVCGTSLYVNFKGVKNWGEVGEKNCKVMTLRSLSSRALFARLLRLPFARLLRLPFLPGYLGFY